MTHCNTGLDHVHLLQAVCDDKNVCMGVVLAANENVRRGKGSRVNQPFDQGCLPCECQPPIAFLCLIYVHTPRWVDLFVIVLVGYYSPCLGLLLQSSTDSSI